MQQSRIDDLAKRLTHLPLFRTLSGADFFKDIDIFSTVPKDTLAAHAGAMFLHEYSDGEIIARHGKFNEYLFLILNGTVRAVIPTEDNPQHEIYRMEAGDFFGEGMILSDEPRGNSAIASGSVTLLAIDHSTVSALANESSQFREMLNRKYIDRKLKNTLRAIPLFTAMGDVHFNEMLEIIEIISMPKGTTVFHEGDAGDAFYLIQRGEVQVYTGTGAGKRLIAILGEGEFFGEMALLSEETRNATVETSRNSDFLMLRSQRFKELMSADASMRREVGEVVNDRLEHHRKLEDNPDLPVINRKILDLTRQMNRHLDIISQCTIDTPEGTALLATMPGSRYPYVYPRDSACASRMLFRVATSSMKSSEIAFRLLSGIAHFISSCQRDDGYWGQRYGIDTTDKGIYKQEDNVAHGVTIIARYLLAAREKEIEIRDAQRYIDAIRRGVTYALTHYYRREIHLFYSTTSIHESAIEEGYTIWVNYAYLLMLRLVEEISKAYDCEDTFADAIALKKGFEATLENVFSHADRYVRRLQPNGVVDLRPDITLLSPFFFNNEGQVYGSTSLFHETITFIYDNLWDPDLGMLQRYLPFIEDPDTHIHAGNGPWIQYTAMLAQFYFSQGELDRGNEVLRIIDSYQTREGYLCEHLTTADRFHEFMRLEWQPGNDFEKEFDPHILIPGISYDHLVEELNHMKLSYEDVARQSEENPDGYITFATPLMWSHAEYAMALFMRTESELASMNYSF